MKITEILGWYGAIALLIAYGLLTFGILASDSILYQVINVTGALGIVVNAFGKEDYPPAFLNSVWVLIALVAIFQIILK